MCFYTSFLLFIETVTWKLTLVYVKQIANGNLLYDSGNSNSSSVSAQRYGMAREMGWRFKREGTYVYLWLIHVEVQQKPTQYWKAVILQLKINFKKAVLVFFLKDEKDKTSTTQNWIYKERSESLQCISEVHLCLDVKAEYKVCWLI